MPPSRLALLRSKGILTFLIALGLTHVAHAAMQLRFDQSKHVSVEGTETQVQIILDADDSLAGDQPVSNGLNSFAIEITYTPSTTKILSVPSQIAVAPQLDFNLVSPGAFKDTSTTGSIIIRGNIGRTASAYTGTLLATLTFDALGDFSATYDLALLKHQPSGFSGFVDGMGNVLDNQISNNTGQLIVISCAALAFQFTNVDTTATTMTFNTQVGLDYHVDYNPDITNSGGWIPLSGSPFNAGTASDTFNSVSRRFYRVRIVPQ